MSGKEGGEGGEEGRGGEGRGGEGRGGEGLYTALPTHHHIPEISSASDESVVS